MDAILKNPYPFHVVTRPLVAVGKRGHWLLADPSGVECPFCEHWQHLPTRTCPGCNAYLTMKRR